MVKFVLLIFTKKSTEKVPPLYVVYTTFASTSDISKVLNNPKSI